jgi:hypothetical protein
MSDGRSPSGGRLGSGSALADGEGGGCGDASLVARGVGVGSTPVGVVHGPRIAAPETTTTSPAMIVAAANQRLRIAFGTLPFRDGR